MSRQRPTAAPETHETRWARPTIFGKPSLLTNAPTQLGGGAHVSGDRFGFQELGGTPQGRRDRHRHRCSAQSPFPHPACLVHRGQASPLGTGGVTGPLRTASDESWRREWEARFHSNVLICFLLFSPFSIDTPKDTPTAQSHCIGRWFDPIWLQQVTVGKQRLGLQPKSGRRGANADD